MEQLLTFEDVKNNQSLNKYIQKADETLIALGFTEHSFAHVTKTAEQASALLSQLGYDSRTCELAKIAGYMHDIGNVINRVDHAQSGAVMAFRILEQMGMDAGEVATIITAIGNHDEGTAVPVNAVAAALILADKSDVRRSRVRNRDFSTFDIHDRVNYAVEECNLILNKEDASLILEMKIDPKICSVMDYFEIFLGRMMLCRKAALFLNLRFGLVINSITLL